MQNKLTLTQSKAGRRFMGFMKVFNSANADAMQQFVADYTTDEALNAQTAAEWEAQLGRIYAATGPMKVFQVIAADEYRVVVLMQASTNGALFITEMAVSEDYPHKIAEFIHRPAS